MSSSRPSRWTSPTRRTWPRALLAVVVAVLVGAGSLGVLASAAVVGGWVAGAGPARLAAAPSGGDTARTAASRPRLPLAGVTIALDPGHQLGNRHFPREIGRLVPAGGFRKPCNTTGTATNGGTAESTVNLQVAKQVAARLRSLGATVRLTRTVDSDRLWGPCVDARGKFGGQVGAALEVSLHADGAASSAHGFHVIAPTRRAPWTTATAGPSLRLAKALRGGLDGVGVPRSSYVGRGTALSIRSDLGTLNTARVPIAMIEVGNMRNAGDARRMTTASGQATYARGVVRGIRAYLGR